MGKGKNRVEGMRATGVRGSGGFTMIEIIVVLVFIGLVTGFATMAIRSTDTHSTRSQLAMVKSHLRYAQARAIHSDAAWGINFSGTRSHEGRTYSNYWLFTNGDAGTPVSFHVEDDARYVVVFSDGSVGTWPLEISTVAAVEFDEWGSPGAASVTIATSAGDIVVTQNTGHIE